MEDFPHYVTQINCLTGAIISETYIRHILRRLYLTTIPVRSSTGAPPRLHLLEGAGWTVGAAGILEGRPREAAPAEPLGQGCCVVLWRSSCIETGGVSFFFISSWKGTPSHIIQRAFRRDLRPLVRFGGAHNGLFCLSEARCQRSPLTLHLTGVAS